MFAGQSKHVLELRNRQRLVGLKPCDELVDALVDILLMYVTVRADLVNDSLVAQVLEHIGQTASTAPGVLDLTLFVKENPG